jgi:hypothetical protein
LKGPNVWPEVPGFQEAFEAHLEHCDQLNRNLHRAICESLGLHPTALDKDVWGPDGTSRKGYASTRILHYTPLALAPAERQSALALGTNEGRGRGLPLPNDGSPLCGLGCRVFVAVFIRDRKLTSDLSSGRS